MANQVEKVNSIAIADIEKINNLTDDNIEKINGLEFTGVVDSHTLLATPLNISVSDTAVSTVDITSGIDSTYDIYEFHCIGIHPSGTSLPNFSFQVDTGTNTNYNQAITSTYYQAQSNHTADGSSNFTAFEYSTGEDQQQGTAFQKIAHGVGDENDDSASVILKLYAPSSNTFVKHFTSISQMNHHNNSGYSGNTYCAGYINTGNVITRIRFKFSAGNIDAGTIKMYGVAKS